MRDRPVPRVGQHRFDVDGQFVGDAVSVEFAVGARAAVETDEPDVAGPGERHAGVAVAAAADEQPLVVDAQAQVTEDALDQAARRGDPAGVRHQLALFAQVGHRGAPR
jgi:hypothetical protein